jgi:hypothetical protein
MLVTRQHGKAAIYAACSSLGNPIQRPRPEEAKLFSIREQQSSAIPAVWTGHGGYCRCIGPGRLKHFRTLSQAHRPVLLQLRLGSHPGHEETLYLMPSLTTLHMYALLTDCAVIVMASGHLQGGRRSTLLGHRAQPVDETDQIGLKHTALWLAQADLASNRIRYVPSTVDLRCL